MARDFLPESIKKRIPVIIAAVISLFFVVLAYQRATFTDNSFLTSLEMRWIDQKFIIRGEQKAGPEVVIVGIDEKTLQDPDVGSFRTLTHDKWATVIDRLAEAQPKVIGFDILFGDPDSNPENDVLLADAIRRAGNVVLGVYLDLESDPRTVELVESTEVTEEILALARDKHVIPALQCVNPPCATDFLIRGRTLKLSLDPLIQAAMSFGFVNFHPDAEGRLRHQPLYISYKGTLYPSLDIQLLRAYYNQEDIIPQFNRSLIEGVLLGGTNTKLVPVDELGRYMLNFTGKGGLGGAHQIVSMVDVLNGRVPPETFRGKIVLIGAEAVGLGDIRPTPFDSVYPGVELHGDVIDNILRKNFLIRSGVELWDILFIVLFGVGLGYSIPRMAATPSIFLSVFLLAAFTGTNVVAFTKASYVLGYVYPGLSLIVIAGGLISYQYMTEEREKKRTKQTFQLYMDPNMIEQVMADPEASLKLGGEKREMSVLFSDIRGFTSFTEKMAPTEVVQFLNQYFSKMQGLIFQYRGTLDKLIGDAVMCFWNHPLNIENHAVRATVCALEMIHAVEDLRPVLILPGGAKFDIGVGVNTGPMVVGNMGSLNRLSYTVMGDNVNLGSRLESLNKYYGTKILISDATYEECRGLVFCRQLDTIQVKGKSDAITIYEPMGLRRPAVDRRRGGDRRAELTLQKRATRTWTLARSGERRHAERRLGSDRLMVTPQQEEIAAMYEFGLKLYRKADFEAAEQAFDRVLVLSPSDGPSRLMKNRIHKYQSEHAAAFDPVYKFDEK